MAEKASPGSVIERATDGSMPSFDFIVESINDSILVASPTGAITYANRRFAQMVGWGRDELVNGMTIFDVVTPKGAAQLKELLSKRKQGTEEAEGDWRYELEIAHKDGTTAVGLLNTTPIKNADGEYAGTIAAITDITERKKAEEQLRKARAELEERVRERTAELNELNEALQAQVETRRVAEEKALEASKAKSTFLANMSHELRTPLNAVIGYTELIDEDLSTGPSGGWSLETVRGDLDKIHRAANHLLSIINDILDLSKVEAGRMDLYEDVFDMRSLLDEIAETAKPLVDKNDNTLSVEVDEHVGVGVADRTKLKQVLLNLLSNAAKFTTQGEIALTATPATVAGSDGVRIAVADTGVGIPQEKLDDLFAPFTQADSSTTREYGGTGLGLTICRRFCELMGGEITVESEHGVGSTFSVRLPFGEQATGLSRPSSTAEDDAAAAPAAHTTAATPGAPTDTRVLVVDDDGDVHNLMRRFLTPRGYHVESAYDGDQGLELARSFHPHVITLDVMMPERDGWSVLTALKADADLARIPVVMISMINDDNIGYALGASEYLVKPIGRDRLMTVLERFRTDSAPRQPRALIVEDDRDTREMLERHLEREGWQIDMAENGRVALDQLEAGLRPDVMLLDLMMPEIDGFEVARRVRATPEWNNIPIIVLTAMDLTEADRKRLDESVERVLQKGRSSIEEVIEQIARFARAHSDASSE